MATTNEEELKILEFWKKNHIYDKLKKARHKGKKFYFMDGPPYATGHIHMGTALNKTLKDVVVRSQRMQGKDVFDRPGYDTHGVPIEFQIEKEIGSKSKKDIERYGVKKFVDKCKEYATKHIDTMNNEFMNLGVWLDWKNPYITLEDSYIEAIWHTFKEADNKHLLYLGKYSVHVCPRCETGVAYNEIEYTKQNDTAIFVKFPLTDKKDTFLIIWTTTPWTLPANTGIMVHPTITYQEIKLPDGEHWIIAKDLIQSIMDMIKTKYTVVNEFEGKHMAGWHYDNPLSKHLRLPAVKGYKVVLSGRYVTTQEGSGLVHCAPGHGKEDFEVGTENGLDILCPVGINGILTQETGKYAGKRAREVDTEIIADLEQDNFLVYKHTYTHDYPLCWRCKSPLLMLAQPQWYLKISQFHTKLLGENEKVQWVPDYMKLRMKAWLEGIGDWPLSRQRYWGTPLPIWHDPQTGEKIVVGSLAELRKLSGKKNISLHKPEIDEITIKGKSGKVLRRVPEVLDVWFDSGVSSWAALGYPADKALYKKFWPADLNIEGRDMFRGWWNSQIILSQVAFGKAPFESIAVHGLMLDLGKRKMSKSIGNVVSPQDVITTYGRDYLRYYLVKFSRGEDFIYNEKEFVEIRKVFTILQNIYTFISQLNPKAKQRTAIEDKWVISKFNSLIQKTVIAYKDYKFYGVIDALEQFIVQDLSRTYIKLVRERADEVYKTLENIYIGLLQLLAPIAPFMTERVWQQLRNDVKLDESIHLSMLPPVRKTSIHADLEKEFSVAMQVIEKGLSERDKLKIGLKWPLADATYDLPRAISTEVEAVIARQLNVKKIIHQVIKEPGTIKIVLNTTLTPELEAEGYAREIARRIQAERKARNMRKEERIVLELFVSDKLKDYLTPHRDTIAQRTGATSVSFTDGKEKDITYFEVKDERIGFAF